MDVRQVRKVVPTVSSPVPQTPIPAKPGPAFQTGAPNAGLQRLGASTPARFGGVFGTPASNDNAAPAAIVGAFHEIAKNPSNDRGADYARLAAGLRALGVAA